MSTREDFEAWAISVQLSTTRCEGLGGYAFYETRKALESWQAATSRQEAKINALVEALEHALSWFEDKEPVPAWVVDAQNAIAAAKGTP